MKVLNWFLTIISIIVCLLSIYFHYKNRKNDKQLVKKDFINGKKKYIFIIICAFFCFVLLYKINSIPYGLHIDEAGALYDAMCLAQSGTDRYMNKFPVYLINFGTGQSAMLAYLTAIIIKIIGAHKVCVRLPAVGLSLIGMLCLYGLVKESRSKKEAIISIFIYAICPWNIMKSRWGLDCNLLSSMMIIWMYFFNRSVITKKKYMWLITGILIGLTLYTYAISYILIPAILVILCLYLLITKKAKIFDIIIMGIPIAILAMPLILTIAYNSGWIENVKLPFVTIPKLWGYRINEISIKNVLPNLKGIIGILFSKDSLEYNANSNFGTIYYMSIPIFFLGLAISIKRTIDSIMKKEYSIDLFMTFIFVAVFIAILFVKEININRINAIYVLMIFFIGNGLSFIYEKSKVGFVRNSSVLCNNNRIVYKLLFYRISKARFKLF